MWTLQHIDATDFCSYRQFSWQVPENVTTLVFGNNMDDDSQNSNGSGKSALIEMIAVAFTGEPLRKVGLDEIINDNADEAELSVTLSNKFLGEQMTIIRRLSRKQPQSIRIIRGSTEIHQASVLDYNKYILEQLGLTKEDIFANYILSKRKYKSFLSSSDKEKKELINRFSNGVLVDGPIAVLQNDIMSLKADLSEAEKEVSYFQGRLFTLDEQISSLENKAYEHEQHKAEQIEEIETRISERRQAIRHVKDIIRNNKENLANILKIEERVNELDKGDGSLIDNYRGIMKVWDTSLLGYIQNYEEFVNKKLDDIKRLNKQSEEYEACKRKLAEELDKIQAVSESDIVAFETCQAKNNAAIESLQQKGKKLRAYVMEQKASLSELESTKRQNARAISSLRTMLMGTIECPACHHKWVVDSDRSVDEIEAELAKTTGQQELIDNRCKNIGSDIELIEKSISDGEMEVSDLMSEISRYNYLMMESEQEAMKTKQKMANLKTAIETVKGHLETLNRNVAGTHDEMFDSVYRAIDMAVNNTETIIKGEECNITTHQGVIKSLELSRQQVEEYSIEDAVAPLRAAREEACGKYESATKKRDDIQDNLNRLAVQEARFNEFKTYLANSKIEALSACTNQFLEAIGSHIRLAFSGITLLKSGKVRDKISISLLRDGVDCGSFEKFSQGERCRCEMATILALQKLTNADCDEGKGLDLLVIDEIMDSTDETGLSNIFDALNDLKVTSLIVSHGQTQEGYKHKLIINKQNGISFL